MNRIKHSFAVMLLASGIAAHAQTNSFPNGIFASKGTSAGGSALFGGTQFTSHFHYSNTEDTYIRGGKTTSAVIVGDVGAAVVLGNPGAVVYTSGTLVAQQSITAVKGNNDGGSALFSGSQYTTHFHYSSAEDTYIRGGKNTSAVILGDVNRAVMVGGYLPTPAGYKLYVDQGILTEKVKVALKSGADWADHVFAENYKLMPLEQVAEYIRRHKHLPGLPSAEKLVQEGGIDVNQMFAKQMEKIEELTLYVIELKKQNDIQAQKIAALEKK